MSAHKKPNSDSLESLELQELSTHHPSSIISSGIKSKTIKLNQMQELDNEDMVQRQAGRLRLLVPRFVSAWQLITEVWKKFTSLIHKLILLVVISLSSLAAKNPIITVTMISLLSISILGAGLATNFSTSLDPEKVFTPFNSRAETHQSWIVQESGFPDTKVNPFYVLIHANGENVLTKDATGKLFDALYAIQNTVGYDDICEQGDHIDPLSGERTCWFISATRHWNHNKSTFLNEVSSDQDVIDQISSKTYPGGTLVALNSIIGKYEMDANERVFSSLSYPIYLRLPDSAVGVNNLEILLNEEMLQLRDTINNDPESNVRMEFSSPRSLEDEVVRALMKDLPLLPTVFLIMTTFTCLVFFRCDKVFSRWLLGYGAIITIIMSIMTSFGLMFCIGIPFSVITQILPFIIFGIGLDDTFIITGAFFRTDLNKNPVERIHDTMEDIGMSISLTTITTTFAFILTCLSTVQAIRWLGLYAFTAIFVDFVYQITYFVAILVLDERRIEAGRRDVCIWIKTEENGVDRDNEWKDGKESTLTKKATRKKSIADKVMVWYAKKLLTPTVKVIVLVLFSGFFASCIWSTTRLTQEFRSEDFVPDDSYVRDFVDALDNYFNYATLTATYFRDVDQSDPQVQEEMVEFMDNFTALKGVGIQPPACWVKDFNRPEVEQMYGGVMNTMTFYEKLDLALANPAIQELYGGDIVRDPISGNITASRCWVLLSLDIGDVEDQIDFLKDQRALSASLPVNEGRGNWSFFSYTQLYFVWEFYSAVENELIFNTVTGIIAVSIIGFILISHWSAVMFVFPMIFVLYIDVLGTLQFLGLHINSMTFVCIVISVGLLVDFFMHILLRYYESPGNTREEKVRNTLETMGASILVGGLSTLLGILPLAFSTSIIVRTVFFSFLAMVTIGCGHGLIFLPVVLSLIGPVVQIGNYNAEDTDDCSSSGSSSSSNDGSILNGIASIEDLSLKENENNTEEKDLGNMSTPSSVSYFDGEIDSFNVDILVSPSGYVIDSVLQSKHSIDML